MNKNAKLAPIRNEDSGRPARALSRARASVAAPLPAAYLTPDALFLQLLPTAGAGRIACGFFQGESSAGALPAEPSHDCVDKLSKL